MTAGNQAVAMASFSSVVDTRVWSAKEIEAVAHALNTRSRKTLGWKTPTEAFNEHLLLL
jgi:IS30 family transposase